MLTAYTSFQAQAIATVLVLFVCLTTVCSISADAQQLSPPSLVELNARPTKQQLLQNNNLKSELGVVDNKPKPRPPQPSSVAPTASILEFTYSHDCDDWMGFCNKGTSQSPLNLPLSERATSKGSEQKYAVSPDFKAKVKHIKIQNTGSKLFFNARFGNLAIGKDSYQGTSVYFHAPSEHTFDGVKFPLEAQFFYKHLDGREAAIAVLFQVDPLKNSTENAFLKQLNYQQLPLQPGDTSTVVDVSVATLSNFAPDKQFTDYYRYTGSHTTPPCREGVEWSVMVNPESMSSMQHRAFAKVFERKSWFPHGNSRPAHPLGGRLVYYWSVSPPENNVKNATAPNATNSDQNSSTNGTTTVINKNLGSTDRSRSTITPSKPVPQLQHGKNLQKSNATNSTNAAAAAAAAAKKNNTKKVKAQNKNSGKNKKKQNGKKKPKGQNKKKKPKKSAAQIIAEMAKKAKSSQPNSGKIKPLTSLQAKQVGF
jgi:carbonic anhydrase